MKGPAVGDEVLLMIGDQRQVPARVDGVSDVTLTLCPIADGGHGVAERVGARLRFTNSRGVCSFEGVVSSAADALLFVRDGAARLIQRREHVRVDATVPVAYRVDEQAVEGYTVNVSGGGFVLARAERLGPGQRLHCTLRLDEPPGAIDVYGTAVREAGERAVAVHIEVIAPGDRERLIHWIFQRQRIVRALRTGR